MPRSKGMFFLAWLLIIVVGAYVNFQTPEAERDWYGYGCAMLIVPFACVFSGVVFALLKAVLLIPYLLIKELMARGAIGRWLKYHTNSDSLKSMFIWGDFSCFYIPAKNELPGKQTPGERVKNYRTKEEYEKLKKAGKI